MAVLGAATLELNADAAKLEKDLGAAVTKATALGTAIGQALGSAIEKGIGKLSEMVTKSLTFGEDVNKASQKLGLTTEEFSAMAVQADLADVSAKSLGTSLRKLGSGALDAAQGGTKAAARAFEAMGIAVTDAEGKLKGTKQLFDEVGAKLASYEDSMEKSALATAVFGKSGVELIPLFNDLEKTKTLAQELGLVMSKDQAEASERFNDNMKIAKMGSQAVGLTLAQVLLPTLEKFSLYLVESAKNTERLGTVARVADTGLKLIATGASIVTSVFKTLGDMIGGTAATLVQFMSGNFANAARLSYENFRNLGTNIGESIGEIEQIWTRNAGRVAGQADKTSDKLAAPAIQAVEKVAKAKKEIDRSLQDYLRIFKLQEESRQGAADDAAAIEKIRLAEAERAEAIRQQVDPARAVRAEIAEIERLWKFGAFGNDDDTPQLKIEQLNLKLMEMNTLVGKAAKDSDDWGKSLGLTFSSAFEDAIAGGKKFSDVLRGIASDIAKLITRKTITEPAGKALEEMVKGSDIGGFFSGLFGGGKASGGPVMGGTAYLVGEQGPELFVPGASGTIVPNSAMGGGVTIHATYQIDSRTDRAAVIQAVEAGNRRLRAELETELAHGGAFRHAVGTA